MMKYKHNNQTHIAFAGGSTGGHVVPIATLIKELQGGDKSLYQLQHFYWFGERGSLEEKECKTHINVQFIPIISGKIRRKPSFKEVLYNIRDFFSFTFGILISLFFLIKYRIDIIFSKGGFVSLPVVIAGWILHIPIVVHESDSKAGISTRIAAKFAKKLFTGFPGIFKHGEYVGQILSGDLLPVETHWNVLDSNEGPKNETKLSDGRILSAPTVLVNCGSLGSASVHDALLKLFKNNHGLTKQFHRIILLGKLNASYGSDYSMYPNIEWYEYTNQKKMGELYMRSDISICRGGSTTLMEQHIFGIKQLIIPIPRTHDQASNAAFFVKEYNDIILDQNKKDRIDKLGYNLNELVDYRKGELDIIKVDQLLKKGRKKIAEYLFLHG